MEPPKGSFVLPDESEQPLVFVAGGIGITPFRSMLRYIEDVQLPHRVTLVYSNRDRASAAFLEELQEIERGHANFRLVVTMTEDEAWAGERRRIDPAFLRDHLGTGLDEATYMVAGPPPDSPRLSAPRWSRRAWTRRGSRATASAATSDGRGQWSAGRSG